MSPDSLARWQFASTTIYHFIIVPISIGLALLVATMQTLAYRRRGTEDGATWDRSARFWGKLMLISFAIGVVTGIVQEFQFGMNWSTYSQFRRRHLRRTAGHGRTGRLLLGVDVPWVVDLRPRHPLPQVHLVTIWLAAGGSAISAYFILAANSGCSTQSATGINPTTGVAEMTSVWKVLTNSTQLVTFPHVLGRHAHRRRHAVVGQRLASAPAAAAAADPRASKGPGDVARCQSRRRRPGPRSPATSRARS